MNRHVLASLILAAAIVSAVVALAVPAAKQDAPGVPEVEAPDFVLSARGVQIYACKPSAADPNAYEWSFVAPEAILLDNGEPMGRHRAGPIWESDRDGSSVTGVIRQVQDGGAGNIAWLQLSGSSRSANGRFAGVVAIRRVATQGGVRPSEACEVSRVGQEVRVAYTADYYFYR